MFVEMNVPVLEKRWSFDPNPDDPDNRSDDVVLYVVVSVSSGCEDQDEVETSDSGIGIQCCRMAGDFPDFFRLSGYFEWFRPCR